MAKTVLYFNNIKQKVLAFARTFFYCKKILCKMKLVLINVFVLVGCVIGAGFMSGREFIIFFNGTNPLFISICFFIIFFCISLLFLSIGKKLGCYDLCSLNKSLFGKWSVFFNAIFIINLFLSVSTMILRSWWCVRFLTKRTETRMTAMRTSEISRQTIQARLSLKCWILSKNSQRQYKDIIQI